jgi:hypothetical protein
VGGCRIECLHAGTEDPSVSDICDIGRAICALDLVDLGDEEELVVLFEGEIRVHSVLENGLDSVTCDRGVWIEREGGAGAGLGLENRSGSSSTFASSGLYEGEIATAESSGVVTAVPKLSASSAMVGSLLSMCGVANGAYKSQTPEFL